MNGTFGSLFSGCLGLDLGLEQAGWEPAWACESDEACQRVIARRRPGLQVVKDVRDIDASMEPVTMLAGGFPCQDLSYAGRGAGLDGDRSGLWFEFARAIRVLRPRLVLVENVPGLATRGLGRVLYDLAEAGYVGSWLRLGAADLGAPHRRERIFIVAAADPEFDAERRPRPGRDAGATGAGEGEGSERQRLRADAGDGGEAAADAGGVAGQAPGERDSRPGAGGEPGARGHEGQAVARAAGRAGEADADPDDPGRGEHGRPVAVAAEHATAQHRGDGTAADPGGEPGQSGGGRRAEGSDRARAGQAQRDGHRLAGQAEHGPAEQAAADAEGGVEPGESPSDGGRGAVGQPSAGASGRDRAGGAAEGVLELGGGAGIEWGPYAPAIERWEAILGRPAPRPTDDRGRLNAEFVEWMLGFPHGWTDGERRTHRLRMLGNSVQVQCGEVMGQLLAEALRG